MTVTMGTKVTKLVFFVTFAIFVCFLVDRRPRLRAELFEVMIQMLSLDLARLTP